MRRVVDLPTTWITFSPKTTNKTDVLAAHHREQPAGHGKGREEGNTTLAEAEVEAGAFWKVATAAATVNPYGMKLDAAEEALEGGGVPRQKGCLRRQRRAKVGDVLRGEAGVGVGVRVVKEPEAWSLAPMKGTRSCGKVAG